MLSLGFLTAVWHRILGYLGHAVVTVLSRAAAVLLVREPSAVSDAGACYRETDTGSDNGC